MARVALRRSEQVIVGSCLCCRSRSATARSDRSAGGGPWAQHRFTDRATEARVPPFRVTLVANRRLRVGSEQSGQVHSVGTTGPLSVALRAVKLEIFPALAAPSSHRAARSCQTNLARSWHDHQIIYMEQTSDLQ